MRAELVFRRGTPPDATYTFKHALVQDAAYSTLLRPRRQQLHGRIATTLERQFPEIAAAQPELMAQHCAMAGLVEQAIEYWDRLGAWPSNVRRWPRPLRTLARRSSCLPSLPEKSAARSPANFLFSLRLPGP